MAPIKIAIVGVGTCAKRPKRPSKRTDEFIADTRNE
jgi:hypothetical protein